MPELHSGSWSRPARSRSEALARSAESCSPCQVHLRAAGEGSDRFHRHVLHPHAAPPGPRQPGSRTAGNTLNFEYVFRRHRRRRALSPRNGGRHCAWKRPGGGSSSTTTSFVYREDADVAWRASTAGLEDCLYTPFARSIPCARNVLPMQPSRVAGRNQHALGEEPLPDAHQEHDLADLYRPQLGCRSRFRDLVVIGCLHRCGSTAR